MGQDWNRYKKRERAQKAFLAEQEEGLLENEEAIRELFLRGGPPSVQLAEFEPDPEAVALVPREFMSKHLLLPLNRAGDTLVVAMTSPANRAAIGELEFLTGYRIEVVYAGEEDIKQALARL